MSYIKHTLNEGEGTETNRYETQPELHMYYTNIIETSKVLLNNTRTIDLKGNLLGDLRKLHYLAFEIIKSQITVLIAKMRRDSSFSHSLC